MTEVARIKAAVVYKVQTLSAGGFRVTIDGTSQELREAAALMAYADMPGALLDVSFRQVESAKNYEWENGQN